MAKSQSTRKAILVRVGIDLGIKGGPWNAPMDPESGEFVYVPIPDKKDVEYRPGLRRGYDEVLPALEGFAANHGIGRATGLSFPGKLSDRAMHLDPDFQHLTYGDDKQVKKFRSLKEGHLLIFFSALRSIGADQKLVYAMIGLLVVKEVVDHATQVPLDMYQENAHTRWREIKEEDVIIRGKLGSSDQPLSGRLERCIPIGEPTRGAYRLTTETAEAWGGLEVKDNFLQRRVTPWLKDADRFYRWFLDKKLKLVQSNF